MTTYIFFPDWPPDSARMTVLRVWINYLQPNNGKNPGDGGIVSKAIFRINVSAATLTLAESFYFEQTPQ
ncbi:hypothetical protein T265_08201 [Opisthorchis viverrini]|uniref:Uncharacterized protein n=1 Tax=Opisthorchis viverrini TaxID=6198 RepID=A0A075A928_OPIVI|nr:hypothetical protein T265_08201 [Opisthorchis viverrini]KER24029.1 hypothetical protein T265_08201 [Opisthorchis viverrini]